MLRVRKRMLIAFQLTVIVTIIGGLLAYQILNIEGHKYIFKNLRWPNDAISYEFWSEAFLPNVSNLPKIQYNFPESESTDETLLNELRRDSIKNGFLHAWNGYTKYAWGYDMLQSVTNSSKNNFNGWGVTIIDALDTMWIMGLKAEFNRSRDFVKNLNFTKTVDNINVFETIIRYLGGLLSAHELSQDKIFLEKAYELGIALLPAFESLSGLPHNLLHPIKYDDFNQLGDFIQSPMKKKRVRLAEIGSMQLEFMKLSQLTGDNYIKFGGGGDSFYEYLIKVYIYVGGAFDQYRRMYVESVESMKKYLIRESVVENRLILGELSDNIFSGAFEHLGCFVPGMLGIGAKVLNRPQDLEIAIRLAETCYWAYISTHTKIAPEIMWVLTNDTQSKTQHEIENLPVDVYKMDPKYYLRPETIERLFILYRITGNKTYQEKGWEIWQSIVKWCETPAGYSGLKDVNSADGLKNNEMESFFFAETLKYLYLLFSPPDTISLDAYVFNTEAHPLLRILKS
ncbi:11093_t:CDS:2 [Racocetra persica]|uniref:11093_t:CDS:1 n=1 Tax=Racocetra persica TaxID=160502 RepID=A0ACA9PH95_9GLOM|nr:11093_t:CDS:2 [Racocetra persica]